MSRIALRVLVPVLLATLAPFARGADPEEPHGRVHSAKITILSTMLADDGALGEWGFSALVQADGHNILFDTGLHSDVVLKNAAYLGVELESIPEVVLSHNHSDHVGGLLTLRDAVVKKAPGALARAHVGLGIFYPRTSSIPRVEVNPMVLIRPRYEATGGVFVVHDRPVQLYSGVWLTGPVPRVYDERNWSGNEKVTTPAGTVEDNIPEDMSLVLDTDKGLVVITGCGHAGVANIVTYSRLVVRPARVHALIGGVHLFAASDETLRVEAGRVSGAGIENLIGAHCTGIEAVFKLRQYLSLDRAHAVVGAVGQTFDLEKGIAPGEIAQ